MESIDWYAWVMLPIIVFSARVVDVSLGTMRIIYTSRGKRNIASLLGFVEVFIWIVVVSQIIRNVQSLPAYIAYAAGFATGTFVGMKIEEGLALGTLVLRIILPQGGDEMAKSLREAGYGVTIVNGEGASGAVKLLYTVIKRKDLDKVAEIIHAITPTAFFSVEEVRLAEQGIFPSKVQISEVQVAGGKSK
jgi:uncharacterized protein YebE (UPF0316 family)